MSHQIQIYFQNYFEIIELKNNSVSAKVVVNIGNTLFSFIKNNTEKLYFPYTLSEYKSSLKLAGNPFMHPWANRLEGEYIQVENQRHDFPTENTHLLYRDGNNLPLHGLLLKSDKWKTTEIYDDENTCYHIAEMIFDDSDFLSVFPYKHKIQIKHQLQNNELKIETTVFNLDEKPMPVSFGYHPYFLINDNDVHIGIPADDVVEVNSKMIPTGNIFDKNKKWNFLKDEISLSNNSFDDGFQNLKFDADHIAKFSLQTSQTEFIEVQFDKNYAYAQIYAPKQTDKPYVCIEPMTAASNALNKNTCKMISNNESFIAGFTIVL